MSKCQSMRAMREKKRNFLIALKGRLDRMREKEASVWAQRPLERVKTGQRLGRSADHEGYIIV